MIEYWKHMLIYKLQKISFYVFVYKYKIAFLICFCEGWFDYGKLLYPFVELTIFELFYL